MTDLRTSIGPHAAPDTITPEHICAGIGRPRTIMLGTGHVVQRCARLAQVLACALLVGACTAIEPCSHSANPLGWPARGLTEAGFALDGCHVPVVEDVGRLLFSAGRLIEAPALLVEGLVTASGARLADAGETLVKGTGGTLTAAINVPLSIFIGLPVDLAREADAINAALAALDRVALEHPDGARRLIPCGTRVRADGKHLVWSVPGRGDIRQRASSSLPFAALTALPGAGVFVAQERSWGFVVPGRSGWDALDPRARTVIVIHEFWHQYGQIERLFGSWSVLYWPAYQVSFALHGWDGHWAETGPSGAVLVDRALRSGSWFPAAGE